MNETTPQDIVISREFDAPRELVWKAWTDPEIIKKWWGPKDFTAPSIKLDFREGGSFLYVMHGPVGSAWDRDMYTAGIFKEIVPMEKIVATDYFADAQGNKIQPSKEGQDSNFPEELTSTILFEDLGNGKTKLSIVYPQPENAAAYEAMLKSGMEEGWGQSLDKLAAATAESN